MATQGTNRSPDLRSDFDPGGDTSRTAEDREVAALRNAAREAGEPEPPCYGATGSSPC